MSGPGEAVAAALEWHLARAGDLARAQVTALLQEPAHRLPALLRARSAQLAQDEAELATVLLELGASASNPQWGAFA